MLEATFPKNMIFGRWLFLCILGILSKRKAGLSLGNPAPCV